jgi:hypothetical protein
MHRNMSIASAIIACRCTRRSSKTDEVGFPHVAEARSPHLMELDVIQGFDEPTLCMLVVAAVWFLQSL